MSSIIPKPFDSTMKILRAIFKGSPNLFTTSDLNRQLEAFDYRLRQLEWFRGLETDMSVSATMDTLTVSYTYIRIYGCTLYEGTRVSSTIDFGSSVVALTTGFIYMIVDTITYTDDASHLVSGAKFADNTSKAAADHLVVTSWGFAVSEIVDISPQNIPNKPMVADGTSAYKTSSGNVPNGALLIPIIRQRTDDGVANWLLFKPLTSLVQTLPWRDYASFSDDEGGAYLDNINGGIDYRDDSLHFHVSNTSVAKVQISSTNVYADDNIYCGMLGVPSDYALHPFPLAVRVTYQLNGELRRPTVTQNWAMVDPIFASSSSGRSYYRIYFRVYVAWISTGSGIEGDIDVSGGMTFFRHIYDGF